jgi:hydroxymethylbilane synthase
MSTIRVLSRESALAIRQAELVLAAIKKYDPALTAEIITMKTEGDRIQDTPLDTIGGKGLFVKELDAALRAGRGDICVHSMKDMPALDGDDLPIVAVSRREDARDALVLPKGATKLDFSKPIGCSSARRAIQLRRLYPRAKTAPVRGNVTTRLDKLDAGEYSALVLASAGLRRLGLASRISRAFAPDEMIPAACQGIIAVQGAGAPAPYLVAFHDERAAVCAGVERAFIAELGADCFAPVAVYARHEGDHILINAMYAFDGEPLYDTRASALDAAETAARAMARGFLRGRR